MASLKPTVLIDYRLTLNGGLTNPVFRSDYTYYIAGQVDTVGTNTVFEAGTIFKSTNSANAKLVVNTPIDWRATAFRPITFTSCDDSTLGEVCGTGNVSGYYAATALSLNAATNTVSNFKLAHLRIAYAKKGLELTQKTGHELSHVQFVQCQYGLVASSAEVSLRNALFYNVLTNLAGSSSTGRLEHVTVDTAACFHAPSAFSYLYLTNCLLVGATNVGSITTTNQVAVLPGNAAVFQTVLAGGHYLADGTYRNCGSTNIAPALKKDFQTMTTHAPIVATGYSASTTLGPTAVRDTDQFDLGYHYAAADLLWGGLSLSNVTLTLTNGVAIGVYGAYGADLGTGVTILSQGTPNRLNVFCRYNAVQELTNGYASPTGLFRLASCPATRPVLRFRFTDFAMLGGTDSERTVINTTPYYVSELGLRDCLIRGGRIILSPAVSGGTGVSTLFALTNNIAERADVTVSKYYFGYAVNLSANLWNNLFYGGSLVLAYDQHTGTPYSFNPPWTVKDCHFDTVDLQQYGSGIANISKGYNGYRNTTSIGGGNDVTLTAWSYAAPTNGLGRWYHGMTNLVNCGSRAASTATLYHFTTQAGQAKETSSIVDIGFHYAAVDATGAPLDYDGDGFPDYLEDGDGDGALDSGETDWQASNSGISGAGGLQVFTPLK